MKSKLLIVISAQQGAWALQFLRKRITKQEWGWRRQCFSCLSPCLFRQSHFPSESLCICFQILNMVQRMSQESFGCKKHTPTYASQLLNFIEKILENLKEIKHLQEPGIQMIQKSSGSHLESFHPQPHPICTSPCVSALFLTCFLEKTLLF